MAGAASIPTDVATSGWDYTHPALGKCTKFGSHELCRYGKTSADCALIDGSKLCLATMMQGDEDWGANGIPVCQVNSESAPSKQYNAVRSTLVVFALWTLSRVERQGRR